jgi:precorrin-4/cobalt-precorrin-4 C11-methyltransferase
VVVRASWPDEQVHETTVEELATTVAATGATRTVLVLVGEALAAPAGRSRLYAPEFAHSFRRRSVPGTTAGRPA